MLKKIILLILITLMLFGCSGKKTNDIVGTWKNNRVWTTEESVLEGFAQNMGVEVEKLSTDEIAGIKELLKDSIYDLEVADGNSIEFCSDGTYRTSVGSTGEYETTDKTIIIQEDKYQILGTYELSKEILIIKVQGVFYQYKRIK